MPLSVGERLGHYEVLSLLGQGGMGEVYRARDTMLKRDVALKVLPATLLGDPERMIRFQREAEVLASLDQTNIGPIYGIIDSEESRGLVLALIEGPTLADQIAIGPLPLHDVLSISKQIIEALEYAHDRGVVHRDLKPANIKITPDGVVKVLDFGLAKVLEDEPPKSSLGNSPTMTLGHTRAGVILGTAAYMSPEQAIGRPVDRRSDIFSFGAVLYEMLTGLRAFTGTIAPDVLEAVVKNDPDWSALPDGTPGYLRRLLERTLAKDRKERLQAIGEARIMLAKPQRDEPALATATTTSSPARFRIFPWVAVGVLGILAAVGLAGYRAARSAELKPLIRLDVDLGADVSQSSGVGADTILSPDGTRIVYASQGKLLTRRLDQSKATELAGTEGAFAPFFSPNGQWVAFFTAGKLKKISVEGGAAIVLCDSGANARGGSWGEDGTIIAALDSGGGLARISEAGGAPAPMIELLGGEGSYRWPNILPGGKAVLFTARAPGSEFDAANIEVMSLGDHRRKTLQRGGTFGRYVPGPNGAGHLLYMNKGTLFAVPFDPDKLEIRGSASPVLEEVVQRTVPGSAQFDVARNGTLVYRHGAGADLDVVQWMDTAGRTEPLLTRPGHHSGLRLSPDGQRLALENDLDIWVFDLRRDAMTRLTFNRGADPVWSPDGRYVVFSAPGGIWWVRSDGAGQAQRLVEAEAPSSAPSSFTTDGKRLAYTKQDRLTSGDIWTSPMQSDNTGLHAGNPEIFLKTSADERQPVFSPDGHWLAYTSNESGTYQVYVRAFPDRGGKWQVSNAGGTHPSWSNSGHELFFRGLDFRIMVATYTSKPDSFVADKTRVWSDRQLAVLGAAGTNTYVLAPDGKRIAALMPEETPEAQRTQSHVTFLLNFADELERKVPTGK